MNNLREQGARNDLSAAANHSYVQIETSALELRSRWNALREDYIGLGAEETESEVLNTLSMVEDLLTKLADWRELCSVSQESDAKEAACNQGG